MNDRRPSLAQRRTGSLLHGAVVLAFAIILTACGGDAGPGAQPTTPGTTPTASTPTTPVASSPPVAFGTPTKIPKTTKPSPSASATGGSTGQLDLTCARRGVDTQGITVHTKPGGPAGFNSLYSDGSSSVDGKSDYKTGYDAKFADSSGVFRSVWIPPANAPTGPVIVRVITGEGPFDLIYTLVAGNGSCP